MHGGNISYTLSDAILYQVCACIELRNGTTTEGRITPWVLQLTHRSCYKAVKYLGIVGFTSQANHTLDYGQTREPHNLKANAGG